MTSGKLWEKLHLFILINQLYLYVSKVVKSGERDYPHHDTRLTF
jgi:hypothetical protein